MGLRLLLAALFVMLCACEDGAPNARRVLRENHAPEVQRLIKQDIERHLVGVQKAGDKLGPGFLVEDAAKREREMRGALKFLRTPPKGISELMIGSARSFVAAVGADGVVIAIDADKAKDRMTGVNLGKRFKVLQRAFAGEASYAVEQFPALEKDGEGSWSLLFAAPARRAGKVVGAALVGIPLWRLAQRLTRQLQLDNVKEKGVILWAYLYLGDKLHHFGTPPDLDTVVPDHAARQAGLSSSAGGFTGEVIQFGRWYGYGVLPLPRLGPEMGAVIFRSDPI